MGYGAGSASYLIISTSMHADMLLRHVWDEHVLFLKNLMPWLERARRARSNHAGDDPGGGHREVPTLAPSTTGGQSNFGCKVLEVKFGVELGVES